MKTRGFSANFLYSVLGASLPILISLGTVPFYIREIGQDRYGIVTITWVLLGYFGFLDFGMSRASANALSKLTASNTDERSRVLMTTFYSNLVMGCVGGLILLVAGELILQHVVKIPGPLRGETAAAYPWMAAMLPLGMISGVYIGALESRDRFLVSNVLSVFGIVSGQLIPLLSAYVFGPSLQVVIPATLIARLLTVGLGFTIVAVSEWPINLLHFDIPWLRRLFGYGSWVSVSSLLNPLLDTSTQLVVGALLGASGVTRYSVPMTLAMRSQVVATALARTMFPQLSRSSAQDAIAATERASTALAYGFGLICCPAILFCGTFLHFWISANFALLSASTAQILMFGAWTNGLAFLPYNFLQAQGRPNITAIVGMIEIVPFMAMLWVLIHVLGLPGAALAWTLRVTINCVVLFVLVGGAKRTMLRTLPAIVLMLLSLGLALTLPMTPLQAIIAATIGGLAFGVCALVFDRTLLDTARSFGTRLGTVRTPRAL